jgi:short-subunit dehydrogenase
MGKALAKQLAEKGANVCIVARNKDKLDQAIEYIKVLTISKRRENHSATDKSAKVTRQTT